MGEVQATAYRLPVQLVYYEACLDLSLAKARERQLKTGFGRAYLKRRLGLSSAGPSSDRPFWAVKKMSWRRVRQRMTSYRT
jgi:hypothetical protein